MAGRIAQDQMLVDMLKNAYSMEKSIAQNLKDHADKMEEYPDIKARVERHQSETEIHAEKIKGCIERLGEETSAIKEGASKIVGAIKGIADKAVSSDDNITAIAVMEFATENFEIATYKAIITTATELGEDTIAEIAGEILGNEMDMAKWLDDNLSEVVIMQLNQKEEEMSAGMDEEGEENSIE